MRTIKITTRRLHNRLQGKADFTLLLPVHRPQIWQHDQSTTTILPMGLLPTLTRTTTIKAIMGLPRLPPIRLKCSINKWETNTCSNTRSVPGNERSLLPYNMQKSDF